MVNVGQQILIHYRDGTTERSPRRITKVFANGRIQIQGKAGNWYEEEPGMFRNWNNPGYLPMVAIIEKVGA